MRLASPIKCVCIRCLKPFHRWRRRGSMVQCTPCSNALRVSEWIKVNPERAKQHSGYGGTEAAKKRYAQSERGKEIGRMKATRWYWKNPEKARALCRARYQANRDREIQKVVDRSKRIQRATPPWVDVAEIGKLYSIARKITRETGIKHQVDHIMPLNGKGLSGLHVPWNLRIVTEHENKTKSNKLIAQL